MKAVKPICGNCCFWDRLTSEDLTARCLSAARLKKLGAGPNAVSTTGRDIHCEYHEYTVTSDPSRFIQISQIVDKCGRILLTALCKDGSIWFRYLTSTEGTWTRVPPLPPKED